MAGIKDIKELKGAAEAASNKGFGYFIKNVGIVLILFILIYIMSNPILLQDPLTFFSGFSVKSLWSLFTLFVLSGALYQLIRSIMKDNQKDENVSVAKAVAAEAEAVKLHQKEEHVELVKKRFKVSPKIEGILKDILIDLGAARACVFEMHNGTNSLVGTPFIFADANWEEVARGYEYVSDDFKNFNLSKYPFVINHFEDGTWIGSATEIEEEDPRFASKLKFADAPYNAFVVLQGITAPIGFLVVSFSEEHPDKATIIAELNQKSQIISTLLDRD